MTRAKMVVLIGGFTIAEILVALAIAGILLAAVAFAMNAAFINYRENEDIFEVIRKARLVMHRITTDIRTADAADPCSPANECTLWNADGHDITYRYEHADNKLYLITNDDLTDPDYVLCDNVTAMTFEKVTFEENSETKVRSFQISMTVARGNAERTIPAAAVMRRNLRR